MDGPAPIPRSSDSQLARILDLFEEHVYAGEITPSGSYVDHASEGTVGSLLGGEVPAGAERGEFWESRILADDWAAYEAFNRRLLDGEDAEVTYRIAALDGVTRVLRDRARPRPKGDGGMLIDGIISDLTAREEATARAAEAHDRFTSLLDVVGAHVYLAIAFPEDGTMQELFQGPGGDRLLGGAEPDPEMVNWDNAVHPEDRAAYEEFNLALAQGEDREVVYRLIGLDGVTRWVHDRAVARPRPDGTFEVSGIVSDVTERRRLEDRLRQSMAELEQARAEAELRANTDDLTGAYNRRHFAQIASASLASAAERSALLLIDADHFKQINDVYGHAVGDAVLAELAQRLRSSITADDHLARWGGEEFAVLLRDVSSEAELAERAERLRYAVSETPIEHEGIRILLTTSVGAVLAPEGASLDALVERADACLYTAKYQGRNRVSLEPEAGGRAVSIREPEVIGMARALAFASSQREGIPEEHAEQVARLAMLTAERLQLPVGIALLCRIGGWLHDVGKIAIPERILTKPSALEAAEWAVMRTHPVVGDKIVRRVAGLHDAAPAVRHHHERFGGGGYPDGLAGEAIPIEARIVCAADAYSAMTTNRPYSAARSPQEAAAELRRSAGAHFDPKVVEALLAVLGLDGEAIADAA
ncbi:MAG TPA: diguanylate cyclase [Gaiellales bacterium]|nr:diguanylate cyclase [Gaiellales bacterium]